MLFILPDSNSSGIKPGALHDANVFNNNSKNGGDFYNYHRPHGGLGGQPPTNDYAQKSQTQP